MSSIHLGQRVRWQGRLYTVHQLNTKGDQVMATLWDGRRRKLRGPVSIEDLREA